MSELANTDRKLKINVSGTIFVIKPDIINKSIKTPLASLTHDSPYYDISEDAFCFSRDPDVFYSVLNYFRYGELHLPKFLCGNMIRKELEFWGIPENSVSRCCLSSVRGEIRQEETLSPPSETPEPQSTGRDPTKSLSLRARIWLTMDDPDHSLYSKIWHNLNTCVVLLHTCVFMIWNEEIVRVPPYLSQQAQPTEGSTVSDAKLVRFFSMDPALGILCIAIICNVFFTVQLTIQFVVSPAKMQFIRRVRTCTDAALICVTWFVLLVEMTISMPAQHEPFNSFYLFCTGLTSARLLLVFRASRLNKPTHKLLLALKQNMGELFLLMSLFLLGVVMFGTMVYYTELYHKDVFSNIYDCLWWAVVTMTTVGYGDMYPVSTVGRVVGGLCCFYGVFIIVMAVSIMTATVLTTVKPR